MSSRRTLVSLGLAVTALAVVPGGASAAKITEVGTVTDGKAPRCPDACSVVTRTTALPTSVDGNRNVYVVPSDGRIVAWSITLGTPSDDDRKALEKQLGRASAGLVVLRRGKSVAGSAVAGSSVKKLDPYFGGETTFALPQSIAVKKGDVVRAADAAFEHATAPHRYSALATHIVNAYGLEVATNATGLDIDD